MKILIKLQNWYDKVYYTIAHLSIKRFWDNINRWFSYYLICIKVHDFDYSSILEVERFQITRVRDCIAKYQNHLNWERDVQNMNLALKLLDIIEENGCSEKTGKDFEFKPSEKDGLYELVDDSKAYYTIPVYVNTRNFERFWEAFNPKKFEDPKYGNLWRDCLRIEKAWYLYHKLRLYFLRSWWD